MLQILYCCCCGTGQKRERHKIDLGVCEACGSAAFVTTPPWLLTYEDRELLKRLKISTVELEDDGA